MSGRIRDERSVDVYIEGMIISLLIERTLTTKDYKICSLD